VARFKLPYYVSTASTGIFPTKDKQYVLFEQLVKQASRSELLFLANHKSPTVRVYSFWALKRKQFPDLKPIRASFHGDEAPVTVASGCTRRTELVVNLVYQIFKYEIY
ncbi:MAG: hypothetical protein AAF597_06300, partial [Bacteroidota bacterium]